MIDPSERLAEIAAGRDLPGAKGAYWRFASIADPAKAFGWIAGERVRGTPSAVRAPPALLPRRAFIFGRDFSFDVVTASPDLPDRIDELLSAVSLFRCRQSQGAMNAPLQMPSGCMRSPQRIRSAE